MNKLFLASFFAAATLPFAGIAAITHTVVNPGGAMVNDPLFGPSRVETVNMCLQDAGVRKYQELVTDSHFANYEQCMSENT